MREIVRVNQFMLPKDIYLVMVARKSILRAKFDELNREFARCIKMFLKAENGT